MRSIARRTSALVAVPALALTGLVAASTPASATPDPTPSTDAAAWLEAQLTDGVVHNDQYGFDDVALSADVGFALARLGGHDATVDEIAAAIAPRAHDEWYTSTFEGVTTLYAGSVAKAAAFADVAGADPTDFGGEDLIALLEDSVSTTAPTNGRVQDENNSFGDTNTFGQAYAVQALHEAGSPLAASVVTFLLQQQCPGGWFRLDLAARDAAEQKCRSGSGAIPDTDATAIALAALVSIDDPALEVAGGPIERAEAWLLEKQRDNGAWGGGPTTKQPNANSTGLAGWVLAQLGNTEAAQNGAAWLRSHQLANVGGCAPYRARDLGAVAYDDALRLSLRDGIDATTQDQARRATAGALALLPLAEQAGDTQVLSSPGYVKAGGHTEVGVIGAAPGEALCAQVLPHGHGTVSHADELGGEAHLGFRVPDEAGTIKVRVSSATGRIDTVELHSLGKATLRVSVTRARVAGGATQTVTVRGLAPGEPAQISVAWPTSGQGGSGEGVGGQANRRGVFKATFEVPNHGGAAVVKARGQFKNRKGSTSFIVTR